MEVSSALGAFVLTVLLRGDVCAEDGGECGMLVECDEDVFRLLEETGGPLSCLVSGGGVSVGRVRLVRVL